MDYGGWELSVIIGLTVVLVASYAFGSIMNRRIQKAFWEALRGHVRRYSRRVSFKSFGSSGFKVGFRPREGPLQKVEISLVLLAREMPLYIPLAYALSRRDRVVVKANLISRPTFHLEVLGRKTPLSKDIKLKLEKLKPVEAGALSKHMSIVASKPSKATELLSGAVFERLVALRRCLERFSISRGEPHVIIVCRRDEEKLGDLFGLLDEVAKALAHGEEVPRDRRRKR
ncbi:MAG TPA: hypothetical protein ENF34_00075 [Candidatus Bathyarchaeota archaeon]|nr:hypothetical protein [Candidatus Bathyarchaeota archaeon]